MDACHILLGRPWQFDVDVTHKGRDKSYMFQWNGKRIIVAPLGSKQRESKGEGQAFLTLADSYGILMSDIKQIGGTYALVIKPDYGTVEVPEVVKRMQEEFP